MDIARLLATYRDGLLEDTIPFWSRYSPDYEYGGFLTFLDRDGSVYGPEKPVWLQGRIAWVYSTLYNRVEKRTEWLELARHAVDFLLKHCFDADGRMFFLMTRDGRPLRKRRYVFSEVFAAMGLAEYAKASGEDRYRARAAEVFDLLLRYHRTPGMLEPKVNPQVQPSIGHTMPMILLCCTQTLRTVDDRPIYREVADESIELIFSKFCKPELRAVLEMVAPDGSIIDTPDGRTILPGHAIESAWFLMEEGRLRGDLELSMRAIPLLEWSLERGWDEEYGGLLYYVDLKGLPRPEYQWDMKLWWPHTEALYATLLAWHLTGEQRWADWHIRIHEYAYSHFPDPQHGEWFGYLHRDGTLANRCKGNCWKGPYHLARMQLYCWKLLEEATTSALLREN